jgi:hypothetical protein
MIERFGDIVAYPILGGLHHRYARTSHDSPMLSFRNEWLRRKSAETGMRAHPLVLT